IAPVLRVLKKAAPNYFAASGGIGIDLGVEHAIDALGSVQTRESTSALIELLDLDLSRFGCKMYHRDGCRRLVAIQLINNTGESFGRDPTGGKRWFGGAGPGPFQPK